MNEMIIQEHTIDSREVARMVEKNHKELLRDIRGYIENMESDTERKIAPSEFFRESSYIDPTGRTLPRYDVTRKGCEFIANKLTGQKGTIFTAAYINRFHKLERMEAQKNTLDATDRNRAMYINAVTRQASLLYKMSNVDTLSTEYKNILIVKAAELLTGVHVMPPIQSKRRTMSAADVGEELGISAWRVGNLANTHDLKTPEHGEYYKDKSPHGPKEVDAFRYYDSVIPVLRGIINEPREG